MKNNICDEYNNYRPIFWLNFYQALIWSVFYLSLIFNKAYVMENKSKLPLIFISALHLFLLLVPAVNAYAFLISNKLRLKLIAEGLNYSLLLLVSIINLVLYNFCCSSPYGTNENAPSFFGTLVLIEFFLFVIPAAINIKYLKKMSNEMSSQALT